MTRMLVAALAVSVLASAAFGQQQSPSAPPANPANNDSGAVVTRPGPVMSADEIKARLQEEGYTDVSDLVLQGPSYEAKAQKDGRRFNLTVDARTGAIRSRY
jgi:uncharacterized membrane protein YkoI